MTKDYRCSAPEQPLPKRSRARPDPVDPDRHLVEDPLGEPFGRGQFPRKNPRGRARRSVDNDVRQLGAAYKSRKAGGDVKKKGQYEPYAYVPLDGRSYSKKNRRRAVEEMATVVPKGGKRKRN